MDDIDELDLSINISYYNSFPNNISKNSHATFLYLNARSLRNSLTDLQDFLNTQKFTIHIVIGVETWLNRNDIPYFNLNNYQAFHNVRNNKIGGGVAIYVHNSFDTASLIYEDEFDNNNILGVSLLKLFLKRSHIL